MLRTCARSDSGELGLPGSFWIVSNACVNVRVVTDDSPGDRSLSECFKLFDLIHRVTTKHAVITRITREVLHDFHADGVVRVSRRPTARTALVCCMQLPTIPTPGSLQGECRAGGRVHTPSRVAPSVRRHQLNTARQAAPLTYYTPNPHRPRWLAH